MTPRISISLASTHDGADKVYNIYLTESGPGTDLFVVSFSHGGRCKALKAGVKTPSPIDYLAALKIYSKLCADKMNGSSHYQEVGDGKNSLVSVVAKVPFGITPQQPTAINREALEAFIENPSFGFQIKANGENRLFSNSGALPACGGNKKGQQCSFPSVWESEFKALGKFIANGEHVGDKFFAFDLLSKEGVDVRGLPQRQRYQMLIDMHQANKGLAPHFEVIECLYGTDAKRELLLMAEVNRLEGIVAKDACAPYTQGRGQDTLKFVFREVSSFVVMKQNVQRSVEIGLHDNNDCLVSCGNVTIPVNKPVPSVGTIVEVQYMYWNGKALEIPVFDPEGKSPRDEVDLCDCTFDQITRFKPEKEVVNEHEFAII